MTTVEKARLIREYERLRKMAHELDAQAGTFGESLTAVCVAPQETIPVSPIADAGLAAIVEGMVPAIRRVIREELKTLRPLDEAWYEPSEVAAMSCGKVTAYTLRNWLRWGQIDGESNGRQVVIYQHTVEELRQNKWRPLRQPDPSKMPPSLKKIRKLPSE